MQQILIIQGGNAFDSHEEYMKSLHEKEISLERIRSRDWKGNLGKELGPDYDVLVPRMPNSQNARYEEWKIIFDKIISLVDEQIILVGHSLGGIFLAKYLSENEIFKKIKAVLLVAAPFNTPTQHPLVDFNLTTNLDLLAKQARSIILYQSRDDEIVYPDNASFYQKELPDARLRMLGNRGHFNTSSFPEIIEDIKSL